MHCKGQKENGSGHQIEKLLIWLVQKSDGGYPSRYAVDSETSMWGNCAGGETGFALFTDPAPELHGAQFYFDAKFMLKFIQMIWTTFSPHNTIRPWGPFMGVPGGEWGELMGFPNPGPGRHV